MDINDILSRFNGVKETSQGKYQAKCPAHKDNTASLTITDTEDKIILYCHAGCEVGSIIRSIGLSMSDLFKDSYTNFIKKLIRPLKTTYKPFIYI